MRRWLLLTILIASPASAHGGHAHGEAFGWSFEPWAIVPLLLVFLLYCGGLARLLGRAEKSRAALRRNAAMFLAGWIVLVGATVSPLHEGGEHSFTLHMIEHELIMLVAAPLMALSRPLGVMIWALPPRARTGVSNWTRKGLLHWLWRRATAPLTATLLQIVVIWLWHAPGLFELALRHDGWHIVQHICFLVSALLFWWAMVFGRTGRQGYGLSALYLFVTSMAEGGLGALMTFAISPWYADYAAMGMGLMGLSPEQDQQLAGLVMWIPGGMIHAGAALVLMMRWLFPSSRKRDPASTYEWVR